MIECPDNATEINCGLLAAQRLVKEELVVVDNIGMRTPGKPELLIDARGQSALEVLSLQQLVERGLGNDVAELGCITCGKCVQIIDEYGDMSASIRGTDA